MVFDFYNKVFQFVKRYKDFRKTIIYKIIKELRTDIQKYHEVAFYYKL